MCVCVGECEARTSCDLSVVQDDQTKKIIFHPRMLPEVPLAPSLPQTTEPQSQRACIAQQNAQQ